MSKQVKRLVSGSALRVIRLDDIQVDESYQREVKKGHKKIVTSFNENALGIILVAEREDATLWVVDGLQRITALRTLGKEKVRAEVFASRGPEHEAEVFKLVNMNRTKLDPREEFRAMLAAHDPDAWKIKELVESVAGVDGRPIGYRLAINSGRSARESGAKELMAFRTMLKYVRLPKFGPDALRFALKMIGESWPGDRIGVYADVVGGLAKFYVRNEGVVDETRLLGRLRTTTPHAILYASTQTSINVGGREPAVADQIEKVYKKRLMPRRS